MASVLDTVSARLVSSASVVQQRTTSLLDRVSAPQQRDELVQYVLSWAHRNPRLSLFVALNLFTLGPPLLFFTLFSVATLLTALSLTLLFALGVTFAILGTVGVFILAPALIIGATVAGSLFVAITLGNFALQRLRPGTTASDVVGTAKSTVKNAATAVNDTATTIKANTPTPIPAPSSAQGAPAPTPASAPQDVRPAPISRTPSEQRAREMLARQALGIPASVPLTTSTDAAVAAAAQRQRAQSGAAGAQPERLRLADQIRIGEEIARRALEGQVGIPVGPA